MQEDLLQPHLSVDEAMYAASQLKLGLNLDPKQRQATVRLLNIKLIGTCLVKCIYGFEINHFYGIHAGKY